MACFLIDYENECGVALGGMPLINFSKHDEIVFFYSEHNARLTMEFHQKIESMELKKLYIPVEAGKQNALDFQLATYLGACIQKHPKKKYYIVSKDHDYNCVCHFWNDKGVFVKRINHIYEYCG